MFPLQEFLLETTLINLKMTKRDHQDFIEIFTKLLKYYLRLWEMTVGSKIMHLFFFNILNLDLCLTFFKSIEYCLRNNNSRVNRGQLQHFDINSL